MSVWLAYHLLNDAGERDLEDRLGRVERYNSAVFSRPLVRRGDVGDRMGAVAWDFSDAPCRWPAWTTGQGLGVATAYAPLGWQRVIGDVEPEVAPPVLAHHLLSHPGDVSRLAPPFALAIVDRRRNELTILNDGLGFARIYTMHFPGGQVWSNRLSALPIFARVQPQIDSRAWRYMAGNGWFMGSTTPIEGVHQLSPSTRVRCWADRGRSHTTVEQTGAMSAWTAPSGAKPDVEAVAAEMVDTAKSVSKLWRRPPVVHLSGGRDSRMVGAAVVASGIDAVFHTVASLKGELDVAQELLARIGSQHEHRIVEEKDVTTTGDLSSRTLALHRMYDGVYGPAGIKQPLAGGIAPRPEATLSGAGGEIARGNFYLGKFLAIVEKGRDACFDRLDRLYRFHGGVHESVHAHVGTGIEAALVRGEMLGVRGPSLLDYFYLDERLRRWSNASTRLGSVAPLVTPAFIRASFDCTPTERLEAVVPLGTIGALVPAWRDVGFYKAGKDDYRGMTRPRIWETSDREILAEIVESPQMWDDLFDTDGVRALWSEVEQGVGVAKHEMLLQRLVWRAYFDEHLKAVGAAATSD